MKKRLLLVGASHADIPVIEAAKRRGFHVITSGNNPRDRGHAYSDEVYLADYSDPEAILEAARGLNVDALCASANDFSLISCAYTAERLGLPGFDWYDTAITLHHKDRFRKLTRQLGLPMPKAIRVERSEVETTDLTALAFPVIVKPIDLSGGKGISKVSTETGLPEALSQAFSVTRQNSVVVEEFIEGSRHGYSTILQVGKINFAFMDDEHYFLNPFLVSGASTSLHYTEAVAGKLNAQLESIAAHLGLVDGLLHVQFILKEGTPYIIEICRRTPGDLYVKLVDYATGYNLSDAIAAFSAGDAPKQCAVRKMDYITRHCVMGRETGNVCSISYGIFESMIFDKMQFYRPKDTIRDPLVYKAEIDFIRYKDKEQCRHLQPKLVEEIEIRLCP